MQYAVIALPRQGKTYVMTYYAHKWVKQGLNTYINYTANTPADAKDDAAIRPWPVFEDQMFFHRSKFIRDEAHVYFSAYRWKPNELEQAAIAMHGKGGNDVYYISQVGSYLGKFLREICETFMFVKRRGPDGRSVINAIVDNEDDRSKLMKNGIVFPGGWAIGRNYPVDFKVSYFWRDQLDDDNLPRKGTKPYNIDVVPFDMEVARSYRSDEIVVPAHLLAWKRKLELTAQARAMLPRITGDSIPPLDAKELGLTNLSPEEQTGAEALLMQIYGANRTQQVTVQIAS